MKGPILVTGAAGFIGSNLVDGLLADGETVIGYDNFLTGRAEFLTLAEKSPRFHLVSGDLFDLPKLTTALRGCGSVIHLAANADVRRGLDHPLRDFEQNTTGTMNVLEVMRTAGVRDLVFASTGSVYGDTGVFPTPENAPMPQQTSLYGASKLAAEGFIAAYAEGFGLRARICRFVSILGPRYSHGHVFDFCRKLRSDAKVLRVLGDGTARKSYLAVEDCVAGIKTVLEHGAERTSGFCEVYNLGTDDSCRVSESAQWISDALGLQPTVEYGTGDRGWVGDNPFILLDTRKIRALGWEPRITIRQGVANTVAWLMANPWIFEPTAKHP